MKRKFLILLFLSLILVISGCGGNKESKKDGKIKLVFYYPVNVGGPVAKIVEQLTKDFNAENPDIEVEAVYTGNYDDTVTKIQTAAQGGNPPDLFVSLATQRFTMASSEMAMPLDELIAEDGEEGKKYINDFSMFVCAVWMCGSAGNNASKQDYRRTDHAIAGIGKQRID